MGLKHRDRSALASYLAIQVVWGLLIVLTPVAMGLYPSRVWALPFGLVTVAGGLHLMYFRHEYNLLVERVVVAVPFFRYFVPSRPNPELYRPLGMAYTLFGIASVTLAVFPLDLLDLASLLQHLF
jgi:hypothetical protein